jgi:hypothetical protein
MSNRFSLTLPSLSFKVANPSSFSFTDVRRTPFFSIPRRIRWSVFLDLQKDERDETQERDGYDNQLRIFTHRTTSALGLGGAFNARLLESVPKHAIGFPHPGQIVAGTGARPEAVEGQLVSDTPRCCAIATGAD